MALKIANWSRPTQFAMEEVTTYSLVRAQRDGEPDHIWETGENIVAKLIDDIQAIRMCSDGTLFGSFRASSDPLEDREVIHWFLLTGNTSVKTFESKQELALNLKRYNPEDANSAIPVQRFVEKTAPMSTMGEPD
jgi:hypothetical protein